MPEEVVETKYGKHSKYEIVKYNKPTRLGAKYRVKRDGNIASGKFDSLSAAVEWVEDRKK